MSSHVDRDRSRDLRLSQIQRQIGRGEYQVDTQAVAAAIVRRLLERRKLIAAATKRKPGQAECS